MDRDVDGADVGERAEGDIEDAVLQLEGEDAGPRDQAEVGVGQRHIDVARSGHAHGDVVPHGQDLRQRAEAGLLEADVTAQLEDAAHIGVEVDGGESDRVRADILAEGVGHRSHRDLLARRHE